MYNKEYNIIHLHVTGSEYGESNVVKKVIFGITGSDKGITVNVPDLEARFGRPDEGTFVEYGNLTEGLVKSWITGSHPPDLFDPFIKEAIEKKSNSVVSGSGLPWNS